MKKTKPANTGLLSGGKILMVPQAHYGIAEKPVHGIGIIAARVFEGTALLLTRPKTDITSFRAVLGFLDYFDHDVENAARSVIQVFGSDLTGVMGAVFVKNEDDYFFIKPVNRVLQSVGIEKSHITSHVINRRGAVHVGVHLKSGQLLWDQAFEDLCRDKNNLVAYCDVLLRVHHNHIHGDRLYPKDNVLLGRLDPRDPIPKNPENYEVQPIVQAFDLSRHALGIGAQVKKQGKSLVIWSPI